MAVTSNRSGVLRAAGGVALATGVLASAYRLTVAPHSQAVGPVAFRGDTDERVCALTFDDGPNEPFTSALADVLASTDVRATFFQVGQAVARTPDVTRRLIADGHVIGNHSLTHRFARCLSAADLRIEVGETQAILRDVIGQTPALYRPPWLLRAPALFPILRRHQLTAVTGTFCHPLEVAQVGAARIARRATKLAAHPGSVMIFHDGYDGKSGYRGQTVEAVKLVIDTLHGRGYTFTTIDQLLSVPAYTA